jgi:tungstate transport system substrate-binding protein
MKKLLILTILVLTIFLSSCGKKELILVTTTSLDNSGFLEYIIPYFEEEYDVKVKVIARGTGAALALGELGEADILLTHDYDSEMIFMNAGFGEKRSNVMFNHFLIVGPTALDLGSVELTLSYIYNNELEFYSRGDSSGTHLKELSQWELFGFDVSTFGDWYQETGQGMGSTLSMAALDNHYTLADIATFCAMKDNLDIEVAYEDVNELLNQYGVMKVNPDLHNRDDHNADLFYDWILRDDIQVLISEYIMCDLQMFYPNAE